MLPLSNRPREDESGVSSNERAALADVVDDAARLVHGRADADDLAARFLAACALPGPEGSGEAALLAAGDAVRRGGPRTTRELIAAVRAVLLLADRTGAQAATPPEVLGRVAFHGSIRLPFDRRAVLKGHTVTATDAEWSFGKGPVLEATAEEIVRFVLAISDVAPRRPSRP